MCVCYYINVFFFQLCTTFTLDRKSWQSMWYILIKLLKGGARAGIWICDAQNHSGMFT